MISCILGAGRSIIYIDQLFLARVGKSFVSLEVASVDRSFNLLYIILDTVYCSYVINLPLSSIWRLVLSLDLQVAS